MNLVVKKEPSSITSRRCGFSDFFQPKCDVSPLLLYCVICTSGSLENKSQPLYIDLRRICEIACGICSDIFIRERYGSPMYIPGDINICGMTPFPIPTWAPNLGNHLSNILNRAPFVLPDANKYSPMIHAYDGYLEHREMQTSRMYYCCKYTNSVN